MTEKRTQRPSTGSTPATQTLQRAGVSFVVHTFDTSTGSGRSEGKGAGSEVVGYGRAAAAALGVEPERVFKTLVIALHGSLHPTVVALVPVTCQLRTKAVAAVYGAKRAELLDAAAAERSTGYVVGGISPLGQKKRLPTVIDESAFAWSTIYVSAGRRGADIELNPVDLADLLDVTRAAIAERQ